MNYRFAQAIREVPDFPKPGIRFKDITPVLQSPELTSEVLELMLLWAKQYQFDAIVGVESRGFLFGMLLAQKLQVPFVTVRKKGKLPYKTFSYQYSLEYGTAEVEIHQDALPTNAKVLIHDDLLATGGTAKAAAELVKKLGAQVEGFLFVIELAMLQGRVDLRPYSTNVHSLLIYND